MWFIHDHADFLATRIPGVYVSDELAEIVGKLTLEWDGFSEGERKISGKRLYKYRVPERPLGRAESRIGMRLNGLFLINSLLRGTLKIQWKSPDGDIDIRIVGDEEVIDEISNEGGESEQEAENNEESRRDNLGEMELYIRRRKASPGLLTVGVSKESVWESKSRWFKSAEEDTKLLRRPKMTFNQNSKIHVYPAENKKDWTIRFINCGPGAVKQLTDEGIHQQDIEIDVFHQETGDQRKYGGTTEEVEHNKAVWGECLKRLKEFVGERNFEELPAKNENIQGEKELRGQAKREAEAAEAQAESTKIEKGKGKGQRARSRVAARRAREGADASDDGTE